MNDLAPETMSYHVFEFGKCRLGFVRTPLFPDDFFGSNNCGSGIGPPIKSQSHIITFTEKMIQVDISPELGVIHQNVVAMLPAKIVSLKKNVAT